MRKNYTRIALCISAAALLRIPGLEAGTEKVRALSSPDGRLTVTLELKALPQPYLPGERPYYRVACQGAEVLSDSPLGLDFWGERPLERDFEILATDRLSKDTTWENPFGAQRIVPDKYNQMTVSLRERRAPGRRVDLIFRAYNEGIAFRYFLPEQESLEEFALAAENTAFYFPEDTSAYILDMGRFNTHNEGEYFRGRLDGVKPSQIINLPLVAELPGGPWAALLEADLTDYADLYVSGVPSFPNALISRLSVPPRKESKARNLTTAERAAYEQPVVGSTPKATPWRVLLIASSPGRLIETRYLVLNLNPPCAIRDASWIRPGKAAWDWWSGTYAENVPFEPGMNTATMKHYIDFAGAHGFEYMLIDAGWYPSMGSDPARDDILAWNPVVDIPEIIAHAKGKGVGIILWVDCRPLETRLDEALALYEKWGVAGIKVDFMNRDDQEMVSLYGRWASKAAEHRLILDFHGAYKPTGAERTYPNLLTREGVLAMEYNKWCGRVTPGHDVTVPFTRMLAGPMDYTPGAFRNAARGRFVARDIKPMSQGTRAHQLAMFVVYDSPLAVLADYPEAYSNRPGIEFLERVPTVWDDTKVINGEIGEFITVLRRKDGAWFLGAMTNWEARNFEIPLDFLGDGGYEARIFADGPEAAEVGTSLVVSTRRVRAGDSLPVALAPGGGWAVILTPVEVKKELS